MDQAAAYRARSRNAVSDPPSHDLRPSKVQIIRRLSMETYMVRIYAGPLSQECDFVSVEAEKSTPAIEIVQSAARKLRLGGSSDKFELAEVFSSGGQLCKERRLEDMDTPVGIQLLWPKVINAEVDKGMGLFTGYRFYIRKKDPEVSKLGWVECKDQSVVDTFLMSFLQQPVGSKEYQDLCNLPDLNEQTLLQNIKARFNNSKIYTYVGSILIALNPFKFFPIYNPKYVKMYQNKHLGELPPHIFAIADAAYHTMLMTRQNQCIVISGESGSGKTESTNLLLHHLTALSHKGLHGSGVEQTILGAGPVLEAFGNAKTVHNNNSSRFGKFIQVNYKENGMVHGAIVEKYLLEKSRIVSQAKSERNYHVFYYMLAGADEKERESLYLGRPEEYRYLSCSQCYCLDSVDEEHEFARLKQSMEMVGFSQETQRKIFWVLSAVLHLGNIEFKKKGDQHHDESVVVRNEATVKIISQLLKVKEKTVLEALTQKRTTAGDETFTINYKMEDAVATRDAMAKCIYGALFDWIVLKVNQALLTKKHNSEHEGNSIGVLDIFGFEDFGRNSFEQLCINYANEHLQYYFNQHIFKFEQEEYQREGIQWKNIEFIDNTGCLELFSKRPSGLFYLLDEECNFPGATNDTMLSKFTHNHKGNPYYQVPQLKEGAFNIVHYAGKVKYFVKDFREKNSDLVRPEIVTMMKKSTMSFVRELMGIDPVAVLRWSVVRAFFRCFFAFIRAGERFRSTGGAERKARKRFSDSHLQEAVFSESLLKQRRVLAANAMANLHDPDHACPADGDGDFDLLFSKRHNLHEELMFFSSIESLPPSDAVVIRRARKLLIKNKSFKPRPRPALSFRDIKALKAIVSRTMFVGLRVSSKKQPPSVSAQFQWSLSRLMNTLNQANPFFIRCIKSNTEKASCQFDDEIVLRQLRYTGMLATVKIRQSGYNYRLLFEEFIQLYQILLPRGLLSSKEDVKVFLQHSMDLNMDNCQIGKTKVFLRESEKLLLDESLHSAIMQRVVRIQRWIKCKLERSHFLRMKDAIVVLQKHTRRWLAQRLLLKLQTEHDAAVTIQRMYRGFHVRQNYLAYREAIIYLQTYLRVFMARQKFLKALAEKKRLEERMLALEQARARRDAEMYLKAQTLQKAAEEAASKKAKLEEEALADEVSRAAQGGILEDRYLTTKSLESTAALYDKMTTIRKDVHRYETASALEKAMSEKALSERGASDISENVSAVSTLQRTDGSFDQSESQDEGTLDNEFVFNIDSIKVFIPEQSLSTTEDTSLKSIESGAEMFVRTKSPDVKVQSVAASAEKVLELYDSARSLEQESELYAKAKSLERGADLYEKAKSLEKSSDFYEKAKALERSAALYDKAKSLERGSALYEKAKALERGADIYEKAKSLERGAELYENTRSLEKGGEMYENTKALEREARFSHHAEELRSTASDEGVILKGGSAEELEDRDFRSVQRRDSEESSGILEDSDTETVGHRASTSSIPASSTTDVSPATSEADLSKKRIHTVVDRRKIYLTEAAGQPSSTPAAEGGKVYELAKVFLSQPQKDSEVSPHPDDQASRASLEDSVPHPLSPDRLHVIEEVFRSGHSPRHENHVAPEDAHSLSPDAASHLSPFHKAKKHFKNIMGGSRRKKDESDEDGDDNQPAQNAAATSPAKRSVQDIGVYVLPSSPSMASTISTGSLAGKDRPTLVQLDMPGKPLSPGPGSTKRKKKRNNRTHNSSQSQTGTNQSRSNINFCVSEISEWQYSDNMQINEMQDLYLLDEFISNKCRELSKDKRGRDTIFDILFRGALDEFGRELKTMIGIESQTENVAVKYRDLFEKFKLVLQNEVRRNQTDVPLVMALNAFRGFLDEFMKQQAGRKKEKKEERKPVKRDKQKKDMVEYLGHKFLQVQFSIPTFCEMCSSLIWIMDKGQVCQVCKYTCHKKCSQRSTLVCRGASASQNSSNARVFGAPLESLLKEGEKVPNVVERLIRAIETQGLYTEGLYRKSGAAPKARELRTLIESVPLSDFAQVKFEEYPVHVLTTVLKAFFRELPEPLLTYELFDDFLRGTEIKDHKEQVQCMFAVIEKLPRSNYDVFERLTFHLSKVAMHEDSTKMSVNGLAIIFAPCLLRSNKKLQAQESLNQVPKQTSCIEIILAEELATVKSKLADINTLESAEKTAEERLTFVRASLRESRVKGDLRPRAAIQASVQEDEETDSSLQESDLMAAEERVLSAHIATIHKERKNLTTKLPMLETRQASSDEDVLTADDDSSYDPGYDGRRNEEYAVAFDLPANPPFLRHVTKDRAQAPIRRRPPLRHSAHVDSEEQPPSQAEQLDNLQRALPSSHTAASFVNPLFEPLMTPPQSPAILDMPDGQGDENEIMV